MISPLVRHLRAVAFFLALGPSCVAAELPSAPQPFPIDFEANRGQAPPQYRYLFHRDGLQAMFLRNGVDFAVAGPEFHDNTIHLSFLGANAEPDARGPLSGHSNYFLGSDPTQWLRNVSLYSEIRYSELYRGISLEFYGNGQELEHDFSVDPGADPSQIAFKLRDTSKMELSPDGDIEIRSTHGVLRLRKPVAFQTLADGRHSVDAKFLLSEDGAVRFAIGKYDVQRPLVIDPVFVFSTYLGGTGSDQTAGVTSDASGNILVIGTTGSTDFPTVKPLQSSLGSNGQSVFVTKFDPTGKTLIYSTYFGGSSQSLGTPLATGGAIAVDAAGDAIFAGLASSTDIPQAGAIVSPSCQINGQCFFLASLSADGTKLNYSGLIGGAEGNYSFGLGSDLAVDADGNAYLTGITDDSSFQLTPGTLATSVTGYPYDETFVLKVDPTGKLIYSTVIPGNDSNSSDLLQPFTNSFIPTGIAVDSSGDVTIAGTSGLGLPTTAGVVGSKFPNAYVNVENPSAGFLLQLNPTASAIKVASYLPGTDYGRGLGVDARGNFYVTGGTQETNLPVSANAYQKAPVTNSDGQVEGAYVMVLNPQATAVLGATYVGMGVVGGYGFSAIALDSHDDIFVGGYATSQGLPLVDPFVTEYEYTGSIADMVLTELSPDLSTLEFSTYLNSVDTSFGGSLFAGIAIDKSDHLLATGTTNSRNFPTTVGSFEPQLPPAINPLSQPSHSFVTVIDMSTPAPAVCLDTFSVEFGNVTANTSSTQTFHVTNCGNGPLDISSITSSDPTVVATQSCPTLAAGAVCPVTLTFTPVSSNNTGGTVTLIDNAVTIPQTVSFGGQGIAPKISAATNPVSFGHVLVGAPAMGGQAIIVNQGQAQLTISSVSVSGASFSLISNGCTQPLGANNSCLLQLSFSPTGSGTQTGAVLISSNDPATPQFSVALTGVGDAIYGVPSISSIGTPTVLINNGPVTVTITGANYYPQSIAQLNGVALATTFASNSQLQAIIPASSLTSIGEQYLTVVNPMPGGGVSPSITVTPYQTLVTQASALVSVPATGMLYEAIPVSAPANPNTVIPINPATGVQGTPIGVGNGPALLAASSDGSYLFVANQTDLTVQRINLTTNTVEKTYPYTPNPYCSSCSNVPATDLETVPGAPQEVLLSQGDWLSLYNDAGLVNYVPNDGVCCLADPDFGSIALAGNPLTVYGLPLSFGGGYFQTATLTTTGLEYTRPTGYTGGPTNSTGALVISDGTLLYTSNGQVWNPATQTQVGTFPLNLENATSFPNYRNLTLDSSLGEIYAVGAQISSDSDYVVLSAFSMASYALTGSLAFPQFYWPTENHLVRWGTNGLAFIAPGIGLTDQEVYILRSSVVSPQTPNPTPTLTSISPATIDAGAPAFSLTVNGANFLSTSVVDWNGTALSTKFVSAQQLTASVPASDIASAGSAQIAVFNPAPGGGSSGIIDLPIASPVTTTSTLSIVPAGAVTVGASYTLTVSVTVSSGTAMPTGNVIFTIGPATQPETLNASGIATYAGTAPSAAGSLSISAAYQGATGFLPSTSNTLNETVDAIATTTTLIASPQQAVLGAQVALTAQVVPASGTATPNGSVSFYSGSSLLGTESLGSGKAVLSTSGLPPGNSSLTASYAGTSTFAASTSAAFTVAVNNHVPVIGSLSPSFVSAGGSAFTVTISGSGFIPASMIYWGSTALVTQYTSATQLTGQVTAAEYASAGINPITVQTPMPGGGTSNVVQFEVDSPASTSAGPPSFTASTATVNPGSTASYPVTMPSTATDVSVRCLNLPTGATCTYSATAGAVTITTSTATPAGTYQITIVFTETLPGVATAMLFLPIFLLPFLFVRRKMGAGRGAYIAFLLLAVVLTAAVGCAGGSPGGGQGQQQTHIVTSSGVVTLTVQ